MANYTCTVTTNWFKVKDEQQFRDLISRVHGDETIEVADMDYDGAKLFSFGCYGCINGIPDIEESINEDEDCEYSYDNFIDELQACVADDDAIFIFEAGHEKLRYVTGICEVITSKEYKCVSLHDAACEIARSMLGNPEFSIYL